MSRFLIVFKFLGQKYYIKDDIISQIKQLQFYERLDENVFIVCENEEKIHEIYNNFNGLTEKDRLIIYDMDNKKFLNIEFKNDKTNINQDIEKLKTYIGHDCMDIVGRYYKS